MRGLLKRRWRALAILATAVAVAAALVGFAPWTAGSGSVPGTSGPASSEHLASRHPTRPSLPSTLPGEKKLIPAPPGFAGQLDSVGSTALALDRQVQASDPPAGIPSMPPAARYRLMVSSLSPHELSLVYDAFAELGGIDEVQSRLQQAAKALPSAAAAHQGSPTASGHDQRGSVGRSQAPAASSGKGGAAGGGQVAPAPPPSTAVQPASTSACPLGSFALQAADPSIFALSEVMNALDGVRVFFPQNMPTSAGVDFEEDPVYGILTVAIDATSFARDVLAYLQSTGKNCISNNQGSFRGNIDNTALQTYQLLHDYVGPALSTISGQVQSLQAQDQSDASQQLRLEIEAALASPGATPMASDELPTCDGGDLGPCPGGSSAPSTCPPGGGVPNPVTVEAVVTCDLHALQAAGQPTDPSAVGDLSKAASAMSAGSYKEAFGLYQAAYQAIAR